MLKVKFFSTIIMNALRRRYMHRMHIIPPQIGMSVNRASVNGGGLYYIPVRRKYIMQWEYATFLSLQVDPVCLQWERCCIYLVQGIIFPWKGGQLIFMFNVPHKLDTFLVMPILECEKSYYTLHFESCFNH